VRRLRAADGRQDRRPHDLALGAPRREPAMRYRARRTVAPAVEVPRRAGAQECTVGDRRADVLAPGGFTVELQASPMTAEEVWSRELDWRMRLVWIFDAAAAFSAGRLRVWRSAGQQADGQPVVFGGEWFRRRPPEKRYAWDVSGHVRPSESRAPAAGPSLTSAVT
jgi:hypothetical protein